jgi:hypothetical protein
MGLRLLSTEFSSTQTCGFLDNIDAGLHYLYIAVGRNDSNAWIVESSPPAPTDTINDEADFRDKIIGIKKISAQSMAILIKNVKWEPNVNFKPLVADALYPKRALDFYVVTSENMVFECIYAPETPTLEGCEPSLKNDYVETPDGYIWRYLYEINPQQINNGLIIPGWMPVSYNMHGVFPGGSITPNQNSYGDNNANFALGAWHLLIMGVLEDEGMAIPYYTSFRQVGLILDPRDNDGVLLTGERYPAASFDRNSGNLIYLENREVIYRTPDQREELKLVLSF